MNLVFFDGGLSFSDEFLYFGGIVWMAELRSGLVDETCDSRQPKLNVLLLGTVYVECSFLENERHAFKWFEVFI